MKQYRTLLALVPLFLLNNAWAQSEVAIGEWQDHFPYRQCVAVVQGGGKVHAATENSLFSLDPGSGEMEKLTKVNVLSDVGIRGLAWNEPLSMLVVHYSNGNLDLIQGRTATNLGDIKRSNILGDKAVNAVVFDGTRAYLACGFGIVVVDLERKEVRDTWRIGPNGSQVQVSDIAFHNDSIYAATSTGLFVASRNEPNLAAFTNWRVRTDMGGNVAEGPFDGLASFQGRLLLNYKSTQGTRDTLLILTPENQWQRFQPFFDRGNRSLEVSADGQHVLFAQGGSAVVYGSGMFEPSPVPVQQVDWYGTFNTYLAAQQAVGTAGDVWIADGNEGLVQATWNGQKRYFPNGPKRINTWAMASGGGVVLVASGAMAGNYTNEFLKEGVHRRQNGQWTTVDVSNSALLQQGANTYGGTVNDFVAVAVDPTDPELTWYGSWDDGLIEVRNGVPTTIYNPDNSALGLDIIGFEGRCNVAGLDHDEAGNLWMTNPWSASPICVRTKGGAWYSFNPGTLLAGNLLMTQILVGTNGYKWIVRPRGNSMFVFDDGGTLDNTGDDRYKLLTNVEGAGGLPAPDVYCVAEDKEQQIWVGTSKGIAVFYTPDAVFNSSGFDAQQILLEQDGNFQYLLETEAVSAIEVDGANRKWIGTQTGGVFLVSPDGRTQLRHFTMDNSPLPSNTIYAITIDASSGEVFVATDRGIMSFRSDATEGGDTNECATVFPNPLQPGYSGPVAISGLMRDSEVKVADIAGNLVYRTTSLGGQALWPGTDMEGNKVSTGVYMVFVADRTGTSKCRTRVLVVR